MRNQYRENPDFKRIQRAILQTRRRMLTWNCDVFCSMPTGFWLAVAETIYKQIGNCPEDLCHYHIDHIVPLAAFGYGWQKRWIHDPFHKKSVKGYRGLTAAEVLTLLHPDNYRWIPECENLSKSSSWDKSMLINWLKAHPCLKSRRYQTYDRSQYRQLLTQVNFKITGSWVGKA